jgi:hypothetical protein
MLVCYSLDGVRAQCRCVCSLNGVRTKWCEMMNDHFRIFRNIVNLFIRIFRKSLQMHILAYFGTCIRFYYMIATCLRLELV